MKKIKYIIFDYSGVISKPQDKNIVNKMLSLLNLEINEFKKLYTRHRYDYDAGIISGREYWQKTLNGKNNGEIDINKIITLDVKSWLNENELILNYIREIKKQPIHLGILSNMTFDTLKYLQDKDWFHLFQSKLFSCDEQLCKPDKKIYEKLAQNLSAEYNDILFVDDSKTNVSAAEELGINGIHYIDFELFQQQMETIYAINPEK